jgi:glycosyltransferase involved in cell wall biosynthesis
MSKMANSLPKVCFVLTADFAVKAFLMNHLLALSNFYEVTVIVNTNNSNFLLEQGIKAKVIPLAIARNVNFISDFSCLIKLIKIFRQQDFLVVHSVTPKAGLLSMTAAWIARVPLRLHTFTGQVWATKVGLKRILFKKIDGLIAYLTTYNIVDSPSQRQFLLDEKVTISTKSVVFAKGSISGVDTSRFKPNLKARHDIRQQLNINANAVLFLFLGRLTRDKGVLDLIRAFISLEKGSAHLLYVGPDEQNMQAEIVRISGKDNPDVRFVGHTDKPETYMAAADVLCLPSYREGFGSVVIEAAAVGIPTIASRIYGLTDAIVDGETGLLHAPSDTEGLNACMQELISNTELRIKLGEQARIRAIEEFDSKIITQFWVDFYREHVT